MAYNRLSAALLAGASLAVLLSAAPAAAQDEATGLEEVVVTATRQADTVNRVSLSVAAVTQQALDQQGIKQVGDISRLVPGLNISGGNVTPGIATFSIRGIVGGTGAATTGVYLDDTSLTKRANNGVSQNNGAPVPVLFDLERVEVLKGPQGTLYGGSSQGGTVRFITPAPSLTTYSGAIRAETARPKGGEQGYEIGGAFGGPIVQDKLGFRVSALKRKTAGYIDAYSPYTNQVLFKNANAVEDKMVRLQLKWQINDRLSANLSAYGSITKTEGGPSTVTDVYSKSANGQKAAANETFTTPAGCFNTQRPTAILAYNPATAVNAAAGGVAYQPGACSAATPVAAQFNRPSYTYGPYGYLGEDDALLTGQQTLTGSDTKLEVYTLTLNYDFDRMNVKSITSYVDDESYSENNGGEDQANRQFIVGGPLSLTGAAVPGFPLWSLYPDYPGHFKADTSRYGIQQELRFSSPADQRPFTWVAGLFFSNQKIHQRYYYTNNHIDQSLLGFWGINSETRYGITNLCGCLASLDAQITDTELAGFAEVNYWITSKLKVTGGIRLSRIEFKYKQLNFGSFSGRYPNSAGAFVEGATVDSPKTPKIGVTYEFTPNDLVYVTAAKGFRAGGVNSPVSQAICQVGLDQFGITANDVPAAFKPDSVWSYEAGGKFRMLDNKMQLNGAVYRIDWTGIQSTLSIPGCGQTFVQNGGKARSQGVDVQAQFRPVSPLTLTLNLGYTDAKYVDPVAGPRGLVPGVAPSINAGDPFAIPKWQVSFSAMYTRNLFGFDTYLRGDYQWQSGYDGPGSFGVATYNPYTRHVNSRDVLNARFGVRVNNWDVNVFANNLLDSRDKVAAATNVGAGVGITGCPLASAGGTAACTGFTNYNPFVNQPYQRPREVGIQANYRF
jgi:outer membrane receptor protein involved in Fe transport